MLSPLFDAIRPDSSWAARDTVRQAAKKTLQSFPSDLERLRQQAGFIFPDRSETGDVTGQTVELIRCWHIGGHTPSLAALAVFAMENLKVELPPEIAKGVLAGAVLGEVENTLPYHNNMHYRKVLLQTVRLIAMHNQIYDGTDHVFDGRQVGLLLLAACIHDLGHDGKGNTIKGVFEQCRLEKRAFELALPYLEACGMNGIDLEALKVLLLCTDVSPLGDPANPLNQMKSAYCYHFQGQKKKIERLNLDAELSALEKDADLSMMAIILHEADIGTSAGLDYALTTFETSCYKKEMGEEESYPQDVADFLDAICRRQMLSDAGQRLFAANMARVYAMAEKEISEGNNAFPQPEYSEFLRISAAGSSESSSKTIN